MSTFYPFPRLAPELRQLIWELSLEPRLISVHLGDSFNYTLLTEPEHAPHWVKTGVEVVAKNTPMGLYKLFGPILMGIVPDKAILFTSPEANEQYQSLKSASTYVILKAAPPVGLSVCRESRSCLLPKYTGIMSDQCEGSSGASRIPTRVNFTIDTIQCTQYDLPYVARKTWVHQIRRMVLDVHDMDAMRRSENAQCRPHLSYLTCDMSLAHLTVRYGGSEWDEWYDMLAEYSRCEPLPFYMRVANPNCPEMGELNSVDFMHAWRRARREEGNDGLRDTEEGE